jgi:hypothetical protein
MEILFYDLDILKKLLIGIKSVAFEKNCKLNFNHYYNI